MTYALVVQSVPISIVCRDSILARAEVLELLIRNAIQEGLKDLFMSHSDIIMTGLYVSEEEQEREKGPRKHQGVQALNVKLAILSQRVPQEVLHLLQFMVT